VLLEDAPAMSGFLVAACRLIWRSTCPDDLEMVLLSKDAMEVITGSPSSGSIPRCAKM
jgi:hypothetical protein